MKTPSNPITYFDNAATTWPKPRAVLDAVRGGMTTYGANPGRSGHAMGMAASQEIYRCREEIAAFFHLDNPGNVVFTSNCTMSLNMVIKGILAGGGRAVVSDMEHNAVMRPLHALSPDHPIYDVAQVVPGNTAATVAAFERKITPSTRAVICIHASNVFGLRLPIRELGWMARRRGLLFVVDAAQSAGVLPIDMQEDHIDFLCAPGHKSLYGPMGTGILLCNSDYLLPSFIEGGTGSRSLDIRQPEELPDRLESGTLNVPGICGLRAGVRFVRSRGGPAVLCEEETRLMARMYHKLEGARGIELYTSCPEIGCGAPVLSLNLAGRPSEEVAMGLSRRGIAVRAGLHCAPSAHRKMGTVDRGTVRLSPSAFTTVQDADRVLRVLWFERGRP